MREWHDSSVGVKFCSRPRPTVCLLNENSTIVPRNKISHNGHSRDTDLF